MVPGTEIPAIEVGIDIGMVFCYYKKVIYIFIWHTEVDSHQETHKNIVEIQQISFIAQPGNVE
jgi:hypothetical protein